MRKILMAVICLLLISGSALADPVPDDFAYSLTLRFQPGNSLYELTLPREVYQGVTRNDLADICVFNGNGEVVPYALQRPAPEKPYTNEMVSLPIFPLLGKSEQGIDDLSMQVRKDKSGSIINVITKDNAVSKPKIIAYLVDGSQIQKPVSALNLELEPLPRSAIFGVMVESSYDLDSWSTLVRGATIASLNYQGHNLDKRTIEVDNIKAKYFRISFPGTNEMIKLKGVTVKLAAGVPQRSRQWLTVAGQKGKDKPDEYTFDTTGHMPVDRINVRLPEMNTLVKAYFYSRASEKDAWNERGCATIYRLRNDGREIVSPELSIPVTPDRFWLMRIDNSGGGLGNAIPQLEVGWVPRELLFASRGSGPFRLAYGSGDTVGPGVEGGNYLLPELTENKDNRISIWQATAGKQEVLGGDSALRKKIPFNWKQLVLWSVLGIGVIILAFMAIHLYKTMNAKQL